FRGDFLHAGRLRDERPQGLPHAWPARQPQCPRGCGRLPRAEEGHRLRCRDQLTQAAKADSPVGRPSERKAAPFWHWFSEAVAKLAQWGRALARGGRFYPAM